MKRIMRFALYVALIVLTLLVTVGFEKLHIYHTFGSWLARVSVAVVIAVIVLVVSWVSSRSKLVASTKQRKLAEGADLDFDAKTVPLLDKKLAITLQRRVGQTKPVSPFEAQVFAFAITNPASMRPRIVETYEADRRTLRQSVTIEVQLPSDFLTNPHQPRPDAQQERLGRLRYSDRYLRVPFPIVIPYKGELNDEFWVTGSDGAALHKLAYSEYLEFVASVLRLLLLKAYSDGPGQSPQPDSLPTAYATAELAALRCIMQRGERSESDIETAVKRINDLRPSADESSSRSQDATLRLAAELVRKLANRYAIVASVNCDPDGRAIIRYERIVVPGLRLGSDHHKVYGQGRAMLSLLFGARPVRLSVRLDSASTCQSYHLMIKCPEGLYLREQAYPDLIEYLAEHRREEQDRAKALVLEGKTAMSEPPPYYRPRQRLGQSYAHFYARFFPEPREVGHTPGMTADAMPTADVVFVEVPPGSLFRASIASWSCFLLIWLIGFVVSRQGDVGTDAPVILLAFPAVIAGWLGIDAPSRRLLEGTLTARMSLMISAVFALAASGLFMIYHAKISALHGTIPFPGNISFLGIRQASWAILSAAALVNTLHVSYRWLRSTWEYAYLCRRHSLRGTVVEERG